VAKLVKLEAERVRRLADAIERNLRAGALREIRVAVEDVEDPGLWRKAAVMAAHRLGFRATTFCAAGALVLLVHRPVTDAERRQAADAMAALILQGGPGRP
jgi:hypothetical protein